jgi:hypothetical protein
MNTYEIVLMCICGAESERPLGYVRADSWLDAKHKAALCWPDARYEEIFPRIQQQQEASIRSAHGSLSSSCSSSPETKHKETHSMNLRLAATIIRIIIFGAMGAGSIFLMDYLTLHAPHPLEHDPSLKVMAVLVALFCGFMSALQIRDYRHPEWDEEV